MEYLADKIPDLEFINLRQAVHWLAFELKPLGYEFEKVLQRPTELYPPSSQNGMEVNKLVDEAKAVLFVAMKNGEVSLCGTPISVNYQKTDDGYPALDGEGEEILIWKEADVGKTRVEVPIEKVSWHYLNWKHDRMLEFMFSVGDAWDYEGYKNLKLKWQQIKSMGCVQGRSRLPQTSSSSAYTTPHLALMQEAIAHFKISNENLQKHEILKDWFLQQKIDGQKISDVQARYMATFIRPVEAQKGGNTRKSSLSEGGR